MGKLKKQRQILYMQSLALQGGMYASCSNLGEQLIEHLTSLITPGKQTASQTSG